MKPQLPVRHTYALPRPILISYGLIHICILFLTISLIFLLFFSKIKNKKHKLWICMKIFRHRRLAVRYLNLWVYWSRDGSHSSIISINNPEKNCFVWVFKNCFIIDFLRIVCKIHIKISKNPHAVRCGIQLRHGACRFLKI